MTPTSTTSSCSTPISFPASTTSGPLRMPPRTQPQTSPCQGQTWRHRRQFLAHTISSSGVRPIADQVAAFTTMSVPTNVKHLRSLKRRHWLPPQVHREHAHPSPLRQCSLPTRRQVRFHLGHGNHHPTAPPRLHHPPDHFRAGRTFPSHKGDARIM